MTARLLTIFVAFIGIMLVALVAVAQEPEVAEGGHGDEAAAEATMGDIPTNKAEQGKFVALAIGFGLGIAAFGGAMSQGRATVAVLEGLSRNPGSYDKVFTPFILGMVLIESLVIYSLVISLILLGSLG